MELNFGAATLNGLRGASIAFVFSFAAFLAPETAQAQAPVSGAIFTTDIGCNGVDLNIYVAKTDVYLNGGPSRLGAAGLPDGPYYLKVTDPSGGTLLGTSGANRPISVFGGNFIRCYRIWDEVTKGSNSADPGYDDTPNAGGEYKAWVSSDPSFANSLTKTDNFKVKSNVAVAARLEVNKFYDANANGAQDSGEVLINGWKVSIAGCISEDRFTPVSMLVDPGICTVTEQMPIQANWIRTTQNPVSVNIAAGQTQSVLFGNVCLGAGGGLTLGFWSNKNGMALFTESYRQSLILLNLRNASGGVFDPPSYADFRTWLLGASATNMAYMLSAQLATMKLNVLQGLVSGTALIYAPGATSANALGFASVDAVMLEADNSLLTYGLTLSGNSARSYQESLKNALDSANNNFNFVQSAPCSFTFP